MVQTIDDNVEIVSLKNFTENAYLNYSMYVIMDRALPFIGDGLKPVQRRIVYAMSELGLNNRAKYKKSARTVGDVLGKYHPHGDSACYEAMVLMAQPFSYRYPLIDGQGNWGAPDDPKSFAAMRYTESRLAPYANVLLNELSQGTIDFSANFDGTLEEPKTLPARLPNILLNGTTGIAVGMATDIPPHNLREVSQGVMALLDNPALTLDELLTIIPAPDYPTHAEIISSRTELQRMYQTGKGSVRMRATWCKEEGDIVITALPYQVSAGKIMEQIVQQMRSKKLLLVEDLKDESDQENPVRLIVVPRSNRVDTEQLMSHLFATTDLERSYRVNLNMLGLDGRPNVKNLLEILNEWIIYRKQTVMRRLQFRLDKINTRLHLVEGFLIAYLNVDEVIHIIREEDQPKAILMARFNLSEQQVEAILDLKLRHLAKLEEFKLNAEQNELKTEQQKLQSLLGSPTKLVKLIKKEIQQDCELYGDPRRSILIERDVAQSIVAQEIVHSEPITVILSKMGWIRCAKGHELDGRALNYKTGDEYLIAVKTKTDWSLILFDSQGKSYTLDPTQLPSARGQGESVKTWLSLAPGANIVQMISGELSESYLLATDAGYGFICQLSDLIAKNKNGKNLINLSGGAQLLMPLSLLNSLDNALLAITHTGRMLCFPVSELPTLAKGKGNKIIGMTQKQFETGESLRHIALLPMNASLILYSGKRKIMMNWQELQKYFAQRAMKGTLLPRGVQNIEHIDIIIK